MKNINFIPLISTGDSKAANVINTVTACMEGNRDFKKAGAKILLQRKYKNDMTCEESIKYYQSLKEQYEGRNIVFIYAGYNAALQFKGVIPSDESVAILYDKIPDELTGTRNQSEETVADFLETSLVLISSEAKGKLPVNAIKGIGVGIVPTKSMEKAASFSLEKDRTTGSFPHGIRNIALKIVGHYTV